MVCVSAKLRFTCLIVAQSHLLSSPVAFDMGGGGADVTEIQGPPEPLNMSQAGNAALTQTDAHPESAMSEMEDPSDPQSRDVHKTEPTELLQTGDEE